MKIGMLFWILMLIWVVLGVWTHWPVGSAAMDYRPVGGNLLLLVLIGLLGWKVFGAPLKE